MFTRRQLNKYMLSTAKLMKTDAFLLKVSNIAHLIHIYAILLTGAWFARK